MKDEKEMASHVGPELKTNDVPMPENPIEKVYYRPPKRYEAPSYNSWFNQKPYSNPVLVSEKPLAPEPLESENWFVENRDLITWGLVTVLFVSSYAFFVILVSK